MKKSFSLLALTTGFLFVFLLGLLAALSLGRGQAKPEEPPKESQTGLPQT